MTRILVFGMTENPGGIESVLLNYYLHIHRDQLQFDFLCNTLADIAYEDLLLEMGAHIFHVTPRKANPVKFHREITDLFRKHAHEWSGIWVNVCSLANIDYLKAAKKYGIQRRIIHSHNSQNMDGMLRGFLHRINRKKIQHYATDFWACSDEAANWFYPKELANQIIIVHNAIDMEKMRYNPEARAKIRQKYGWENKYIIGHIGRLHFQKNQDFLIDVFEKFHQTQLNSILIMIGQGEDEQKLKEKVRSKKLDNSVFFLGLQTHIADWLSCFDLLLFPSIFEGLSLSLLEAEANGLPILASINCAPLKSAENDHVCYLSLKDDIGIWSKSIEEMSALKHKPCREAQSCLIADGYDIVCEAEKLEEMFLI